jgi:hypothetical protein
MAANRTTNYIGGCARRNDTIRRTASGIGSFRLFQPSAASVHVPPGERRRAANYAAQAGSNAQDVNPRCPQSWW